MLALARGLKRLQPGSGSARPTVSILIAARNEEASIGRCLAALAAQDYPRSLWDLTVIDDGSSDRTAEIARSFQNQLPGLKVLAAGPTPPGVAPKKHALSVGIAQATGEVILTTDADCVPPPGWASGMVRWFDDGVDAVVGHSPLSTPPFSSPPQSGRERSDFPPPSIPPRRAGGREVARVLVQSLSQIDSFINGVVAAGCIGLGIPATAVGRNFAYRKQAWERAGGFSGGASGDDDLLLQRIAAQGGGVRFAADPATFVPAAGPATLRDWWRMKRRHLSAGARYRPGLAALSVALYLFNAGLTALAVITILGMIPWQWLAAIWGVKAAVDGLALATGARLRLAAKPAWAIPWTMAELLSPLIFTVLIPASLVGKVKWKGRELDR